ncbi:GNAT domain-containing protein [Aspergillus pseudoustus]|uniref:GNAT domain-containing protein n=1 Tax=Aspergillus pseudoustus TaxID=1810923 RepID=A0ABR4JSA1_9EURO
MTAISTLAEEQPARGSFFPPQRNRVIVPESIETIHTPRLILRPLALSDAEDIFEHRRLQEVADWLILKVPHKDVQETRDSIAAKVFTTPDASGATGRIFSFAIMLADDATEKVIGALGVNALSPAPSIGYCTHPGSWGQGIGSEAVKGLVDAWWRLPRVEVAVEGKEKLFAGCSTANVASLKVLFKNGFQVYEETKIMGEDVALFELETPKGE